MGSLRLDLQTREQVQLRLRRWRFVLIRCAEGWVACLLRGGLNRGGLIYRKMASVDGACLTSGIDLGSEEPVGAVKAGPGQSRPRKIGHSSRARDDQR